MEVNIVSSSELNASRLDPDFYRPSYVKVEQLLRKFGAFRLGDAGKLFAGPFGSKLPSNLYLNKGIPLFRVSNVGQMQIDFGNMAYLANAVHEDIISSEVIDGDILIVKASVGEKICKIPDGFGRGNITQHIIAFRTYKQHDSDYITSFLFSYYGRNQLERRSLGSIIQYLGIHDARSVLLPKIQRDVETYIGNKVRQAERLRFLAKQLETKFENILKEEFPEAFENKSTGKKYSWAEPTEINYTLNTGAFDEERVRVQRYLLNFGGKRIKDLATILTPTTKNYSSDTYYIGLNSLFSDSCHIKPTTVGDAEITGSSRNLVKGVVIPKLNPYLNKVSYIPEYLDGSVGSTELLCLKAKEGFCDWYLYGVLKLDSTLKQLKPLSTGSTHLRIDQYDVYNLVVPVAKNSSELGAMLGKAQEFYFDHMQLIRVSKLLVEALIEGQLTEAELINAHQALENGDNTLDKAILANITDKGYGVKGKPLFSDLDAFYRLLDEVEAGQAEDGL